jgi:hypothetical protein
VVEKRVENGMHVAELTLTGTNQRGQVTVEGTALVSLPSASGPAVLPEIPAEIAARTRAIAEQNIKA